MKRLQHQCAERDDEQLSHWLTSLGVRLLILGVKAPEGVGKNGFLSISALFYIKLCVLTSVVLFDEINKQEIVARMRTLPHIIAFSSCVSSPASAFME